MGWVDYFSLIGITGTVSLVWIEKEHRPFYYLVGVLFLGIASTETYLIMRFLILIDPL